MEVKNDVARREVVGVWGRLLAVRYELVAIGGILVAAVAMLVFLRFWNGSTFAALTRDPAVLTGSPAYLGFFSNLGVLLWMAAATVAIFGSLQLRRMGGQVEDCRFLSCLGVLTLVLTLDDLYLLHEDAFKSLLGIKEKLVLVAYGLVVIVLGVVFHRIIRRTHFLLLGLAGLFLATSVVIDLDNDPIGRVYPASVTALEDTLKFAGIAFWLFYISRTTSDALATAWAGTGIPERSPARQRPHGKASTDAWRPVTGRSEASPAGAR